jgi:hypothetical protein
VGRTAASLDTIQDEPAVNRTHIFEGEINRRGKPVGFHSRPQGRDPRQARVVRVLNGPDRLGVYVAAVEILDPASGRPLGKRSTFFPDALDREAVLAAIRHAYARRTENEGARFRGPSGLGFTIEGYTLRDGTINTAYPLFR